jgi:hypothetical protein
MLSLHGSVNKNMSWAAVDLRNVLENFGVEILNNMNSVKSMLKEHLTQHFVPMEFKSTASRET